jgi:hypothetical protein
LFVQEGISANPLPSFVYFYFGKATKIREAINSELYKYLSNKRIALSIWIALALAAFSSFNIG